MKKTLVNFVSNNSKLILLLASVITFAMVPGIPKITIESRPPDSTSLHENEFIKSVNEVKKTFGEKARTILIAIEAQGNHTLLEPEAVEKINALTSALKMLPSIERDSIISLSQMSDMVSTKDGITPVPIYKNPPKNIFEANEMKSKIESNELIYGRLISKDFKTTLIIANAFTDVSLYTLHDELFSGLKNFLTIGDNPNTNFKITLVGEPEVCYQLEKNIQKDAIMFLIISMLLILASFYFMFKSWRGVLQMVIAMLISIIWTMGLIGYYGKPISILSAMLPVVIVVVGSAYAIHIFHALKEESSKSNSFKTYYKAVLDRLFSPQVLSTATTVIGGLSLLMFKFNIIQHFGVFSAIGTFFTFVISILIMPAMYKEMRRSLDKVEKTLESTVETSLNTVKNLVHTTAQLVPVAGPAAEAVAESAAHIVKSGVESVVETARKENLIERGLIALSKMVSHGSWFIIVFVLVVSSFAVHYMKKINIGFDNISLLPSNYEVKKVMKRLEQKFDGFSSLDMMIDTGQRDGALDVEVLRKIEIFSEKISKINHVAYVFSVVDVLKKVDSVINSDSNKNNKGALPSSKELAAQYLLLASSSGGGLSTKNFISSDFQKVRVSITTNISDTQKVEKLYHEIKSVASEVFGEKIKFYIGGSLVTNIGVLKYVVWGKIQNILVSLLTILLLIAFIFKSFTRSIFTVLSLPIGVILNFGLMGLMGIRLDITTAIITSFAMGIGVDFSIHFLSALKTQYEKYLDMDKAIEKAITGPGVSITYNALSVVLGFSVLLLSKFVSIHNFALLMCFNMIVLGLCALTLLPAVVKIVQPEFITSYRQRHNLKEENWRKAMKLAFNTLIVGSILTAVVIIDSKAEEIKDPKEILRRSIEAIYTPNEESVYVMKLIGSDGSESIRKMKVWFKSNNKEDAKLLIKFTEPADIRGTGFLTLAKKGSKPDQYLYLPALKKSRKLGASSNPDEPFLGSDFSMADLSADRDDGLEYKVVGSEKIDGVDCYKVEGTPRQGVDVSSLIYGKKIYWIRKDNFLGIRGEFYNVAGKKEKEMTITKISKEGNRYVANQIVMKNIISNHQTVLEFEKRDSSKKIPDSVFTVNYLEKN